MAVTNYQLPTQTDEAIEGTGVYTWNYKERLTADDGSAAYPSLYTGAIFYIREAYLYYDDATRGSDLAADEAVVNTGNTYGGSSNLWGTTLTPEIVNSDSFGLRLVFRETDGIANNTNYLIVKNYGFALPDNATITGIEVLIDAANTSAGGGSVRLDVDTVKMRVHYTWPVTIEHESTSYAALYFDDPNIKPKQKTFRHFVYDYLRNYVGELLRVRNTPQFKIDINNLQSSMTLELAQNEASVAVNMAAILTEASENITTEADEELLADITAPVGLGPGTNTTTNNEVDTYAYYGEYVYLTTEDDYPLLTEDGHFIMGEDGAPQGELIFTGYMSRWRVSLGKEANVQVTVLSHAQELNNIVLETADTALITSNTLTGSYIGIAGGGPGDNVYIAQTFTMPSTQRIRRLVLQASGWGNTTVTARIYQGTPTATVGGVLGTATAQITAAIANDDWQDLNLDFGEAIQLTNGVQYYVQLTVDQTKTGGNPTYPANFRTATGYAGGAAWYVTTTAAWAAQSYSLAFVLYQPGGATTRTFNSTDPGTVIKNVIDFARSRGARVNYTDDTVELTGTTPSITMQTNTIADAIAAVLKAAPADWYYFYDPAYNMLHFHPRPDTPSRYFVKGRNIVDGHIEESIEQLVNDVLFSGGGDPPKYIRLSDVTYPRRGLKKISDTHFTDEASMVIVAQSEIDRGKEAMHAGELTVLQNPGNADSPADEPLENEHLQVGILIGISGYGELIDALQLQVVSKNYKGDIAGLALTYQPPKVSKRVEDIKRELAAQEQKDNPASPTQY